MKYRKMTASRPITKFSAQRRKGAKEDQRKTFAPLRLCARTVLVAALLFCEAPAQTPAPPLKKPAPPVRAGRVGDKLPAAPQVVTIVHRLNGLKMFRLLARSQEQVQAIEGLDSAFNLMDDVHTNVIAGLALDDGETIAAWLPEADVEFAVEFASDSPVAVPPRPPKTPRALRESFPLIGTGLLEGPDISVIGPNGKRLLAKYVGLDAATGLSILKLADKNALATGTIQDEPVNAGETVLVFGPEPATKARALLGGNFYVRMGAIEGRIQNVLTAPTGEVAKFTINSPRFSHANIGGVAINEAGETIGIVDGLEGSEATILPAALIRRAAQRVLEQQASVPRPWLGVEGEPVADLKVDQFLNHGWELKRASDLAGQHRGILLTSIVPGSPAASAALRAGDVILKVDNNEIQNAEDFTWWLDQAGPSSSVQFTVARPDRPAVEPLNVKLSGMLDPAVSFRLRNRVASNRRFSLIDQGIETIVLRQAVAAQLRTTAGLLVVYVDPLTPAFEAGLRPGDVIQSIDGKPAPRFKPMAAAKSFTFEIVRKKEKLVVKVPAKKR
ncbi:MAG TPA: PDZ domain-containing protein [Pyrinomonadaceae bacterium]|nr:PDZ domain-containing protein [Pyrinomonadaceae bacterium]